jgi:hypothetical protein
MGPEAAKERGNGAFDAPSPRPSPPEGGEGGFQRDKSESECKT